MKLFEAEIPSPIGPITVVTDADETVRSIDFDGYKERKTKLLERHYGNIDVRARAAKPHVTRAFEAYFAGDLAALCALPTATNGSPFQKKVWAALLAIPAGATETYGALAARIGQPTASRAVGLANGSNPIAIAVPCHRVVGASGSLTGFGGGIERKRWLLEHEMRHSTLNVPLFAAAQ